MMIHVVTPGPLLITEHPEVFWGLIASMYIGNVMLLILNLPLVGLFVKVLEVPSKVLMPLIILLCIVGAFAINNAVADIWIMIVFGILGFFLRKWNFSVAPLVLALVIGPMLENALMQSLLMSQGSLSIFYTQPLARSLFILTFLAFAAPVIYRFGKKYLLAASH